MKVSYNWLKDYVDIEKSPEQLADDLSLFGHEVESVEKFDDDYVLDLEITPNRGDCLSILGLAREIGALYNLPIKQDKTSILRSIEESTQIDKKIEVQIEKPEICPRFTARVVDNIEIKESPKWIQEKLATYGFRPINNIVDITNYVMVAIGQPLHAFDYDKIKNGLMNVRLSKKGEEVMTLDGKNHILSDNAIIIEDEEKIYDLAGIMGGIKSEVDEKTKTIILQGAIFDPVLIRRASKHLNHTTDASYRYERGVDYEGTTGGVNTATSLILESCPEAKIGGLIDKKIGRQKDKKIGINIDRINKLLGIDVSLDRVKDYLERLGFKIEGEKVTVPSYRQHDVKLWQDIAEEIARMYGYNRINKLQIQSIKSQTENIDWLKRESIKDYLKKTGFTELYSYSFVRKDELNILGYDIADCVEIANPLSPETQFMRPTILPSLLDKIARNPWAPEIRIFEIEKVFSKDSEWWQLGIATAGKSDAILKKSIPKFKLEDEVQSVDQGILNSYKIRRPVRYLVTDIDDIKIESQTIDQKISQSKYQPISKYPPTVRDLAFLVEENVNGEDVVAFIKPVSKAILLVELFDDFFIENLKKKNLAFHIWLQDLDKPMSDQEVNNIIQTIIKEVEPRFKAKLRS